MRKAVGRIRFWGRLGLDCRHPCHQLAANILSALELPNEKAFSLVCSALAVLRLFVPVEESKAVPLHKFVALSKFQIFAHHLAYKLAE